MDVDNVTTDKIRSAATPRRSRHDMDGMRKKPPSTWIERGQFASRNPIRHRRHGARRRKIFLVEMPQTFKRRRMAQETLHRCPFKTSRSQQARRQESPSSTQTPIVDSQNRCQSSTAKSRFLFPAKFSTAHRSNAVRQSNDQASTERHSPSRRKSPFRHSEFGRCSMPRALKSSGQLLHAPKLKTGTDPQHNPSRPHYSF